jgi:mRNA-degrading endonuclease RelE of RelBE toxin-antitoxin system
VTSKSYEIRWTEAASESLLNVRDSKVQERLIKRAVRLSSEPLKQGEPLKHALSGYYSVVAAERYLVIYAIDDENLTVEIICVGIHRQGERSDAYRLATKIVEESATRSQGGENESQEI